MHAVTHDCDFTSHEQQLPAKSALIVDDELSNRVILKSLLKKVGYSVIQAENGAQALALFRSERPDIVFMDVMMPVMDGHEAVRRMREIQCSKFVPIIFLTALTDESVLAQCIEVGGNDFLTKPFSHMLLRAKVAAMERISRLHAKLGNLYAQMKQDEEIAERVFSGAVVTDNVAMEHLRTLLQPAAIFSGDVLLSAYGASGDLNIMLGDFTGHGLAAAIGALPVSETFRAMTQKGFPPAQILAGINRKLHKLLPSGMFFAVQFVSLDHNLEHLVVFNCGMPDLLLINGRSGEIKQHFVSNNLPLGILADVAYEETMQPFPIEQGDRVLLVSDGVLEARSPDNEYFGQTRLDDAVRNATSPSRVIDAISASLQVFCRDAPQDDDISLADIPCEPVILSDWDKPPGSELILTARADVAVPQIGEEMEFSIKLTGARLRKTDPIPLIISQLQEMVGLQNQQRYLFTILTELYINALDHGVLRLDSDLKQSPDGFTRYFTERETRLGALQAGFVSIVVNARPTSNGGRVAILVEDSGPGFDYANQLSRGLPAHIALSGRGIRLVAELCESLEFRDSGNRVEALFSWVNS